MRRKASDIMAECIIEMVHEYKQTIGHLKAKIERLEEHNDYLKSCTNRANEQCNKATDTLGEIADIIAGITEHAPDGYNRIYLNDLQSENAAKLKRLFKLLDIPMTADQIKGDDTNEES